MTSMRLVLGEINPKILLILSSLLVLIALYSFKGKAETVYYFYDVEKPTGTIQNQKYGFWLTAMSTKTTFMRLKFKNFYSRAYRLKQHLENRFSKSVSLTAPVATFGQFALLLGTASLHFPAASPSLTLLTEGDLSCLECC